jgi:hypothetical protein
MTWTLLTLKQEDWDFRKCSDYDLWACHQYEFQRENDTLTKTVAEYRKEHPDFPQQYLEALKPYDPNDEHKIGAFGFITKPPRPPYEASFPPDWPNRSFLSPLRTAKTTKNDKITHRNFFHLDQVFLNTIAKNWDDLDRESIVGGTIWNAEYASEITAFQIYWRYCDSDLIQGFADWLKENRPKGDEWDFRPKVETFKRPTGAAALQRKYRPQLKALGAYRLLLCYKGNRQKAKAHSEDICKALGRNFAHDSAWTEAQNLARKTIKEVATPLDFTQKRVKPKSS